MAAEQIDYEDLLNAWLKVSTSIRNDKIVPSLTYNESVVCHLLHRNHEQGGEGLTATDLCRFTQIQKSQMNRILTALEERELITRTRSEKDRRRVVVAMNHEKRAAFDLQHKKIIEIVGAIADDLGAGRAQEITAALEDLAEAARRVIVD